MISRASYLSKTKCFAGISTVPYAELISGSPYNAGAPSYNGITVGCWVSSGHIPPPALDKRPKLFVLLMRNNIHAIHNRYTTTLNGDLSTLNFRNGFNTDLFDGR